MTVNEKISKFENKVWLILLSVLAFVIVSGFFVYFSLSGIIAEISDEARPDEKVLLMKEILNELTESENNVKSYSLTSEGHYLESYNSNYESVTYKLMLLDSMVKMNDDTLKIHVDSLQIFIPDKFNVLEELLVLSGQNRVNDALNSVSEKITSASTISNQKEKNDNNQNSKGVSPVETDNNLSESEKEEKFFKKLLNKRKTNKANETEASSNTNSESEVVETNSESEPSNENMSLEEINKEILLVKQEETKRDKNFREQELTLIQKDKIITDKIKNVFQLMEDSERQSMELKLAGADKKGGKTTFVIAVFCVFTCILLILAGYIVNVYVKRNEAFKIALRKAKSETDLKNKEITDSITYAQKIQEAILPDDKVVIENLKNVFVLYKPKDIVAGDFYWTVKTDKKVFAAVGDCTGHGVPGAMVSVVCSTALNRCVREFKLETPAEILDKCREIVIETLNAGAYTVNDGMDIALVALSEEKNGEVSVEFAGANNSLYIVKNGLLQDVAADKQPIGRYQFQKSFTNNKMTLKKGELIYMFSDGFAGQFGGPQGKKFKYKPFQDLLLRNASLELKLQRTNLNFAFEDWRGSLEQVDDVCVMGIRL